MRTNNLLIFRINSVIFTNQMKKLSSIQKIILSIFPVLGFLFFLASFFLLTIPYEFYVKVWFALFIIMILQLLYLFRRVFLLKIETEKKVLSIVLILIGPAQLYYIWWLDDELVEKQG